jgi:hypothetical protein
MTVGELIVELIKSGATLEAEIDVEVWHGSGTPSGGEIVACAIKQVPFLEIEGRATLQIWLLAPDSDLPGQGEATP